MSIPAGTQEQLVKRDVRTLMPFTFPFVLISAMYFIVRLPENQPTPTSAFVKCVPILYLIWFVWLQGTPARKTYNGKIFYGLIFSCIGDAILIWGEDDLAFLGGSIAFGLAHIFYMSAFGWEFFGWKSFAYTSSLLAMASGILHNTPYFLLFSTAIYSVLCAMTLWRSMARVDVSNCSWRDMSAAMGGQLFAMSDISLGVNKFCVSFHIQRELIMITYYAAQLFLSLSVINSRIVLRNVTKNEDAAGQGQEVVRDGNDRHVPIANGHCLNMAE